MAVEIDVKIEGLDKLKTAIRRRPKIVTEWLNKAIKASIFELEKRATDDNFEFKLPRSKRTGYLQRSFKFGMQFGNLYGSIGPTAEYAKFVHGGTRYMLPNKFMPRIARASQQAIQKHFNDAVEEITKEMVK